MTGSDDRPGEPMPTLGILVSTCDRPNGLRRLLASFSRLDPMPFRARVIVVDNGRDHLLGDVDQELSALCGMPVALAREARQGIPFARNLSLRLAGQVDFIAFVDDDEEVEPDWLHEHFRTAQEYGADVVAGPVLPVLPNGAPRWMADGGLFDRRRDDTGTSRQIAATGNVLMRRSVLDQVSPWFDESMALTGGTDTELFRRISAAGHSIVWCDTAIAREHVPSTRARASWLLRRHLRIGANKGRQISAAQGRGPRVLIHEALHAARLVTLVLRAVAAAATGRRADALRFIGLGLRRVGRVLGLFGFSVEEYRSVPAETDVET